MDSSKGPKVKSTGVSWTMSVGKRKATIQRPERTLGPKIDRDQDLPIRSGAADLRTCLVAQAQTPFLVLDITKPSYRYFPTSNAQPPKSVF